MPNRLELRIKHLKRHAYFATLFWWAIVVLIGLEVEAFLASADPQTKTILFALINICLCLIIYLELCKTKQEPKMIHQIRVLCADMESITSSLSASQICNDAYIVMWSKGNYRLRILVQSISKFDADLLAKQRKTANRLINKQYNIRPNLSLYDALKMMRVNLVVCDEMSDNLLQWVERDTAHLLGRNESILNAAIVLNQGILLFPDCLHGPSYVEIKKYELAARTLCYSLGAS